MKLSLSLLQIYIACVCNLSGLSYINRKLRENVQNNLICSIYTNSVIMKLRCPHKPIKS